MPRPREFDTIDVLDRAMNVFWAKGYEGTSLQDLVRATNLSKSSFYQAFGSKHDLYVMTLGRYTQTVVRTIVEGLSGDGSGRAAIRRTFDDLVATLAGPRGARGCFLVSSAVDMVPHDEQVARQVEAGRQEIEEAFHQAVRRGQQAGEIPGDRDALALARFLVVARDGLVVAAKTRPSRRALENAAALALAALDPAGAPGDRRAP